MKLADLPTSDPRVRADIRSRFRRPDITQSSELGYMELDKRGAELLIDPRLCAAIVDRLTFKGTIIETGTDSYRLAHTLQQTP